MPPPYRLILFDFDGTLVDTITDIAYYANRQLHEHGFPRAELGAVKEAVGWGVQELFRMLAPGLAAEPERLARVVESFKSAYHAEPVRATKPFPDVVETLSGPLRGVKKAIVTNKPQDITLRILEQLDLGHHFLGVIGLNAGFEPKPDPSALLHLMRMLGAGPAETVYVGDSRVDAETSHAAGVDFAWVEYGYQELGDRTSRYRFARAAEWKVLVS